ncbi:MAG: polymer-forming cytoskeletal protein [Firmicutes bacterium]|nr:polymer-forming cytoskeletal protein [Bacillota bacterium]
MGLFGKKAEEPVQQPEASQDTIVRPKSMGGTIIGEGMTFVGNFISEENMIIHGNVRGDISSTTSVSLSEGGYHTGKINAQNVIISGRAESEVNCRNVATLSETGVFKGKMDTLYLDAEHGSSFEGTLNLKKEEAPKPEFYWSVKEPETSAPAAADAVKTDPYK